VSDVVTLTLPSDAELASAVMRGGADGSPPAEAELVRRFGRRVRLYGRSRLRDDSAVDDLVQRVMLVVLVKLRAGEVQAPDRIDSFVLGTARFVTRELSRAGKRDTPLDEDHEGHPFALDDTRADPLAQQSLGACLEALAARDRAVVALTFFHDQSATEIGDALGMQPGHVRISRHRAIARLRTCMGLGAEEVAA
jgi:RNA polymerase sigma-70 factor (ECF subfamily)